MISRAPSGVYEVSEILMNKGGAPPTDIVVPCAFVDKPEYEFRRFI